MDSYERASIAKAIESATQITVAAVTDYKAFTLDAEGGKNLSEFFEVIFKKALDLQKG